MTAIAKNQDREKEKNRPLLDYPFNWQVLERFDYPVDENGVPQVYMGKEYGLKYNPITIAQFGLFHLQNFSKRNDSQALQKAQNCVNWLIANFKGWRGDIGAWVYDFDLDFYGPKAPWISGMAQAQGISLLLRANQIRPEKRALEITKKAFPAFLHPVAKGGVVSSFPDSSLVFEEFTTEPPSQVLNGHMFALLGIYDYAAFWQDQVAKDLFQVAIRGLKKNLERYDTGYWNLYDLHPTKRLASPMYVKVHVQLLRILFKMTAEEHFRKMADKWQDYLDNPLCRLRWFVGKVLEKIRLRF